MLLSSVLLIVVAAGALVVGVTSGVLGFVWAAVAICLVAAVLLAVGVARARPSRRRPPATPWSGAAGESD